LSERVAIGHVVNWSI